MLSDDLKALKDKSNLSYQEIAEKADIPAPTVTRIIRGETLNPTFDNVAAIVAALHGSLDAIAGIEPPGSPPSDERLIRLYQQIVAGKEKWLRVCAGAIAILFSFVFVLFFYILNEVC